MTTDKPARRITRILVGLDASEHSAAALGAAVDLARQIKGEILGIFVEDENLLRMADMSFTREIRLLSTGVTTCSAKEIRRELRVQAQRAKQLGMSRSERAGVPFTFRVVRGQVTTQLLTASEDIDMIAIGRIGQSHGIHPAMGSTAEAILRRARLPVMVLDAGVRLHTPFFVLFDGSDAAHRAVHLAGEITQREDYMALSVIIVAATDGETRELEAEVLDVARPYRTPVSFHALKKPSAHQLLHLLETQQCGTVLTPSSLLERYHDEFRQMMAAAKCPVIVMR